MSLRLHAKDGASKMSKSAESDASRINLLDSPEVIASKIKRAKTDGAPEAPLPARTCVTGNSQGALCTAPGTCALMIHSKCASRPHFACCTQRFDSAHVRMCSVPGAGV